MIRAKKSLGQNFLISPRIVDMIISAGNIEKDETILEIGPGKGMLTKALLNTGASVIAIEKDNRLIPILEEKFKEYVDKGSLKIIHADILNIDLETFLPQISGEFKVIANIPYYITGQIMRMFLEAGKKPLSMVLMVQKEVADRIMAKDGKESILSISVKVYAKPALVVNVSRGNFFPIPNVVSDVIKLSSIDSPFGVKKEELKFFEVLKAGFSQKRKRLAKNLESVMDKEIIEKTFQQLNIDKNVRAEDLKTNIWVELARR